jgi:hypothetical protein
VLSLYTVSRVGAQFHDAVTYIRAAVLKLVRMFASFSFCRMIPLFCMVLNLQACVFLLVSRALHLSPPLHIQLTVECHINHWIGSLHCAWYIRGGLNVVPLSQDRAHLHRQ